MSGRGGNLMSDPQLTDVECFLRRHALQLHAMRTSDPSRGVRIRLSFEVPSLPIRDDAKRRAELGSMVLNLAGTVTGQYLSHMQLLGTADGILDCLPTVAGQDNFPSLLRLDLIYDDPPPTDVRSNSRYHIRSR